MQSGCESKLKIIEHWSQQGRKLKVFYGDGVLVQAER